MRGSFHWAVLLCLTLAAAGCGDDNSEGASGGTGATHGTGGTSGSSTAGEACDIICRSPCIADLEILPSEVERCVSICEEDAVIVACENEISAFLICYERVNCTPMGTDCVNEAFAALDCVDVP